MEKRSDALIVSVIVFFCLLVNMPYFHPLYYPSHDTLSVFQFFSWYYSELFFNKTFPWWLPFSSYGIPTDSYILFSFGPFQYLTMCLGYLISVKNTLNLFSVSLALDSLLLALGSWLFCQKLLQHRLASLICVILTLILIFYDRQVYWNFKILVAMPMILYLAQTGIERLQLKYLLWAAALLLCWSFGSVTYALVVQFYIVAIYCLVFIMVTGIYSTNRNFFPAMLTGIKAQLCQRRERFYLFTALLTILICLSMMYAIHSVMTNQMAYIAPGRSADFSVGIEKFLNYGGSISFGSLLEIINGIPVSAGHDFLIYAGLINVGLALAGILSCKKNPAHIALLLTLILLVGFTVQGTDVARAAFNLPGMPMVRHITHFLTIAKLFLIFLAGLGITSLLSGRRIPVLVSLAVVASLCYFLTPIDRSNAYNLHALIVSSAAAGMVFLFVLFRVPPKLILAGCLLMSLSDILAYRFIIFQKADLFLAPFTAEFKTVQRAQYAPVRMTQRSEAPVLNRFLQKPIMQYGVASSFLREDYCLGLRDMTLRQDLISSGVGSLFHARIWHGKPPEEPRDALNPHNDLVLKKVLGCGLPKLRLSGRVQYVEDIEDGLNIASRENIFNIPVIISSEPQSPSVDIPDIAAVDRVKVVSFSPNHVSLQVKNEYDFPLWLLYADAYDKRWRLNVDGKAQPLYQANIAFKGIMVKPGMHHIELHLSRPAMNVFYFLFMLMMSGLSASILILCMKKRQKSPLS